jgi:hypothetical protein
MFHEQYDCKVPHYMIFRLSLSLLLTEVHIFPMVSLGLLLTLSFRTHHGPDVDSARNRNEYQAGILGIEGGRCVGLTLPLSCADCLEILQASTSCSPMSMSRPVVDSFTFRSQYPPQHLSTLTQTTHTTLNLIRIWSFGPMTLPKCDRPRFTPKQNKRFYTFRPPIYFMFNIH